MKHYLRTAIVAISVAMSGFAFAQAPAGSAPHTVPTPASQAAPGTATPAPAGTATGNLPNHSATSSGYPTEAAAKSACGSDAVVWANMTSKVMHMSGTRYYGKTKRGAHMCQQQATTAGYHVAKNGQ